jgi:hypothetical protein
MVQSLIEAVDPKREELHALLKLLTPYVYFQPPSNVNMQYPCIVYAQDDEEVKYADNLPFFAFTRYTVTVIDLDPDSLLRQMVRGLPYTSFSTRFAADELHHFVFNLYF